jgi:hypothetical protein
MRPTVSSPVVPFLHLHARTAVFASCGCQRPRSATVRQHSSLLHRRGLPVLRRAARRQWCSTVVTCLRLCPSEVASFPSRRANPPRRRVLLVGSYRRRLKFLGRARQREHPRRCSLRIGALAFLRAALQGGFPSRSESHSSASLRIRLAPASWHAAPTLSSWSAAARRGLTPRSTGPATAGGVQLLRVAFGHSPFAAGRHLPRRAG